MYYLYKFLNTDGKVIYIGRTNDIQRRILKEHFTEKTHLPLECYKELAKIEYAEVIYESEVVVYEVALIQGGKPKYNVQFKDNGDINTELIAFEWHEFQIDPIYLEFLKKRKDKVQLIQDYIIKNLHDITTSLTGKSPRTIVTGFTDYDTICNIYVPGLLLIAGNVSDDTINFAINICQQSNERLNKKILFISSLKHASVIASRMLSSVAMVNYVDLINETVEQDAWDRLSRVLQQDAFKNINIIEQNQHLEIKELEKLILENSYDLVILDDLNSIPKSNTYETDKTLHTMQQLKWLTKKYDIPIIALFHDVSASEKRADLRPMLRDLPYDSMKKYPDVISFIYNDEHYHPDTEKKNITEIITVKNGFGISGIVVELVYLEQYCKYANLQKDN